MTARKTAVIIGAGPAGLTAALEFLRRSDIRPIVLEATQRIGGISCTIQYKGNRMDIGGHRFFSKVDRVMDWWTSLMPIAAAEDGAASPAISYQNQQRIVSAPAANEDSDRVMLIRPRKSRIYFLRSFFDYPLALNAKTLGQLGLARTIRIGLSYLYARLFPRKQENTLEDFLINRFGTELYRTFFKSYTEKVWGVPCDHISAAWGAQRIKGLSLRTAIAHFLRQTFGKPASQGIAQKKTETSLIEKFLYPKYGPGQLWEYVAELVTQLGGEVRLGSKVDCLHAAGNRVASVEAVHANGERETIEADYIFSTMPIRELLRSLDVPAPEPIREIAEGLVYRDFITVGLLVDRLTVTEPDGSPLKDTWIYVQEPDVLLGRLQIFNNWSPYMVADPSKVWIGLEYFCYETDELWNMADDAIARFAIAEVEKIGILKSQDVLDAHVVRVPKTYPAYFGTYDRFDELVAYMNRFENLFLVGRNGMHKYNNQDHSMLTAMTAVDNILAGNLDKGALWKINTEQEYHEEK
jgi:protoporphyrinogen oxidase